MPRTLLRPACSSRIKGPPPRRSSIRAALLLPGLILSACEPSGDAPDLILANGQVVTVDADFTLAEALAIQGNRIVAVGTTGEVEALAGRRTRVLNLEGRTVIPGLIDSHIHFAPLGRDVLEQAELGFAMSAGEIVQEVARLKERLDPAPGEWLVGNRWDQYKYDPMFTRWDLDEVAPDSPVLLNRVYRGVAVNTAAFRLMGIEDDQPETWPDWWLTDPADFTFEDRIFRAPRGVVVDGRRQVMEVPTGVFLGARGTPLVTAGPPEPDPDEEVEMVRHGVRELLELGVTSIVDPASWWGGATALYREAHRRGLLEIRVGDLYEGIFMDEPPERIHAHLAEAGANRPSGPFLTSRGAKFYSDGGAGTRSAWVSESFDRWAEFEGEPNHGNPVVTDNKLRKAQYRAALELGWDLHTHTAGDVSMRQAVDLYGVLMDEVRAEDPDLEIRWSLIHAYFPIEPATRVVDDMAARGIIASLNPVFQWQEGIAFATNVGAERMARMQPFRSYVEAGVVVTSGSDYPVTSHDPWMGFYALLTRRDQATGQVFGPAETLGMTDALRTYTINGAYLIQAEDRLGSLEPGKLADLVVLDLPDPMALERDPELAFGMRDRVLLTMVDGHIRHEHSRSPWR
jgi:predicted amidohydrolase YtcJ